MSKPVITVENLSKAYRIGLKEEIPDTLISAMSGLMKAPFRKFRDLRKLDTFGHAGGDEEDLYWALKDVSFEVQEGEVLGVIGRNGAGKSTLLKILSRITEPTSGRAVIRGRVSSLLEVGTGFHPELSGRENVYLNGTILGMTKREIDRKFDEIVDFSGVEKFLDTPIKRYSSGMKVRLAFAVAAHLEPEILIIDEVLAVGDAEFQKKCMGKMQDVAKSGRTVLFVSHNLSAVRTLCHSGHLLVSGRTEFHGPTDEVLARYSSGIMENSMIAVNDRTDRSGNGVVRLVGVDVRGEDGLPIATGSTVAFEFVFTPQRTGVDAVFTIYDTHGNSVLNMRSFPRAAGDTESVETTDRLICVVEECPLLAGEYRINVALHSGEDRLDHLEGAAKFSVTPGYLRGRFMNAGAAGVRLATPHTWVRA